MGFRDLLDAARAAGERLKDELQRRASPHVRVDARRVFLSDAALHASITAIARSAAPDLALSLESHPDGHLVSMTVGGEPLSAVVVLKGIRVSGGRILVEVETPRGIALEARPVAGLFAGVIARMLGGTAAARAVLSLATPETLTWDGRRATLALTLDRIPLVGAHLAGVDVTATASRDADGVWLEFDRDGVAGEVAASLFRSAIAGSAAKNT